MNGYNHYRKQGGSELINDVIVSTIVKDTALGQFDDKVENIAITGVILWKLY